MGGFQTGRKIPVGLVTVAWFWGGKGLQQAADRRKERGLTWPGNLTLTKELTAAEKWPS